MDRRLFLKGMLTAVSATGAAMVQIASPAEARALTTGRDVLMVQPKPLQIPYWAGIEPEVYARINGEFVPIGCMRSFELQGAVGEVLSWHGTVDLAPVMTRGLLYFEGRQ